MVAQVAMVEGVFLNTQARLTWCDDILEVDFSQPAAW